MMENVEGKRPSGNDNSKLRNITIIVCVIVAAIIAIALGSNYVKQQQELAKLAQLQEQTELPDVQLVAEDIVNEPEEVVEDNSPMTVDEKIEWYRENYGIEVPDKTLDFADLQENTNADIYAWIYIPNTQIDYPVVQHPTDNLYYLNYNLDGSKGYPGCIYTENYNAKDFSDPLTVMYGHNMKNGSMFAGLHRFEDTEFFQENPYIYIYTQEDILVYEIFAAYEYSDAHLLYGVNLSTEQAFEEYLDDMLSTHTMTFNRREDVEVGGSDNVLTLSTCIANKANNRYLVQGVLIDED